MFSDEVAPRKSRWRARAGLAAVGAAMTIIVRAAWRRLAAAFSGCGESGVFSETATTSGAARNAPNSSKSSEDVNIDTAGAISPGVQPTTRLDRIPRLRTARCHRPRRSRRGLVLQKRRQPRDAIPGTPCITQRRKSASPSAHDYVTLNERHRGGLKEFRRRQDHRILGLRRRLKEQLHKFPEPVERPKHPVSETLPPSKTHDAVHETRATAAGDTSIDSFGGSRAITTVTAREKHPLEVMP